MDRNQVLKNLKAAENTRNREGMARYGIRTDRAYGVPIPVLRAMARDIGRDHSLALELWETGIHEARILASMIGDPGKLTGRQMDSWIRDFDSWDVCDQVCSNLFEKAYPAPRKVVQWSSRKGEFEKRAAFALMAALAVRNKGVPDEPFLRMLKIIERESSDDRNYVRKAVNWALRQIGKRNPSLNRAAIRTAKSIRKKDSGAARWIASDAIRELESDAVQKRLRK